MNPSSTHDDSVLSVSELSQKLKRSLETQFDHVRIRGELSKVKIHTSGHLYTDLKDDASVLNAVCWRGTVSTLSIRPEEGLEVICTGKITTYPARSNYQLVIESMEFAGQGAILKMLEDRKKRLAAEGLFDPARKRPLPFLPNRIGVITSATGAVIQDILHRLEDRFPIHVILFPATVQGENTVRDVINGINAFHALPVAQRPDVLIIARGGGSFEDLMPFNDEAIVRAVASSEIPIISAIGHETDTTLIDFAADQRAPTPTAAAEMAVPVLDNLKYTVQDFQQRLAQLMQSKIKHDILHLNQLNTALGDPAQIINTQQQRVDYTSFSLDQYFTKILSSSQQRFARMQFALQPPKHHVTIGMQRLETMSHRLTTTLQARLDKSSNDIHSLGKLLDSYSFKNVLARGFAIVTTKDKAVISSVAKAKQQDSLQITFNDGEVEVKPL
jgi:exodeoxyribonuclease VII large subunit